MISFNEAPYPDKMFDYIRDTVELKKISGDGKYTKLCNEWMRDKIGSKLAMLTTSCTHALEMTALLLDIKPGDEVIMPSYTFVSTASAFVIRGAKPVFVDIRTDTLNIDETLVEDAITDRTKAIVVVHYAGVSCDMDVICDIADGYGLPVIEDAAQGLMSEYKGRPVGSFGTFSCFSFHETKNYSMGEGGALCINDPTYIERAEIIREKGTDRSRFLRGQVDKYTWCDIGSSYLPSDILAAYLWAQLEIADGIYEDRMGAWSAYYDGMADLEKKGIIDLPHIPEECRHNAHMFYVKTSGLEERTALLEHMRKNDILAVYHYVPLHSSPAGMKYGRFHGKDEYTTKESERLVRLPMYYQLQKSDCDKVIRAVKDFYQ